MKDLTLASMDGTEDEISRNWSMSECFAAHGILLVSVGKGDEHPSLHVMQRTVSCTRSTLDSGNIEDCVLEPE